jgi:hypothetical protein
MNPNRAPIKYITKIIVQTVLLNQIGNFASYIMKARPSRIYFHFTDSQEYFMKRNTNLNFKTNRQPIQRMRGRFLVLALFVCGAQFCGSVAANANPFSADSAKPTLKQDRKALRHAKHEAYKLKHDIRADQRDVNKDVKAGNLTAAQAAEADASKDKQHLKQVRHNIHKDRKAIQKATTHQDDWNTH